jgi:hypothetical protein
MPIIDLTAGLREVVIRIIWTQDSLPPLTVTTPPSAVSFPAGALSIRVL